MERPICSDPPDFAVVATRGYILDLNVCKLSPSFLTCRKIVHIVFSINAPYLNVAIIGGLGKSVAADVTIFVGNLFR